MRTKLLPFSCCGTARLVLIDRKLPEYADAEIVRTRDLEVIGKADIVVDVGAVYDPAKHRYDHHQREFTETFSAAHSVTKLSSAGLIYKHFGRRVLSQILGWPETHADFELVYLKIYQNLIEGFDAVDNGVSQYQGMALYRDNTSISDRVKRLNPAWNEKVADLMPRFMKAVEITGEELVEAATFVAQQWLPARSIVLDMFSKRFEAHSSGKILLLEQFCFWKEHLYEIEEELAISEEAKPLYVVYQDTAGSWRVQAISVKIVPDGSRKPLLEPWRGLRDDELSKISGIPHCVFVHATGFIGGNKTKEGALEMAKRCL